MGWATDLHDASFRGVQFECTATTDAYSKALAIHQAPYADDADVEDMGLDPRKISITAMYTGESYKIGLDALEAALTKSGSGELIHPVYGILDVQVQSWQVQHGTENVDYCSISIEFIQAKAVERELFIPVVVVQDIDTFAALERPAQALETELKTLERDDPNAFLNRIAEIRTGLQNAYQTINGVKKTIDDILSPADWAYGLVNDVTRLVTFDITDISAISKWRHLVNKIKKLGSIFDKEEPARSTLAQLWRGTLTASQVAVAQEIVNLTRREMVKSNQQPSLTPLELAVIRQKVREDLQSAIRAERDVLNDGLLPVAQIAIYKKYADQVHGQIQALIETRPPLTTTIVELPSTVHLLAHQLYGDFSRSHEILRLNPTLENPAILRTGQELTVYAR